MDTLEILIAARAEVEKGWCKFFAVSTDGRVCTMGAIDVACGAGRTPREICTTPSHVSQAARKALGAAFDGYGPITHWNDDHRTTKQDVLDLYDRAIVAEAVKVTADTAHTFATVS